MLDALGEPGPGVTGKRGCIDMANGEEEIGTELPIYVAASDLMPMATTAF